MDYKQMWDRVREIIVHADVNRNTEIPGFIKIKNILDVMNSLESGEET